MKTAIETERKYLIKMPNEATLMAINGCIRSEITQTYLQSSDGKVERVRKRVFSDRIQYTHTCKTRLSAISAIEEEAEVSESEYNELLKRKKTEVAPIEKIRYAIPYGERIAEIDVYPFWKKQAVLEIEIESENEATEIPEWLTLIRDVSGDRTYSNNSLSKKVPPED